MVPTDPESQLGAGFVILVNRGDPDTSRWRSGGRLRPSEERAARWGGAAGRGAYGSVPAVGSLT